MLSPEHDGIAARGPEGAILAAASGAAAPLRVALKPYPEDPVQRFREKFPQLDWQLVSQIHLHEYVNVMENCKKHIQTSAKALFLVFLGWGLGMLRC